MSSELVKQPEPSLDPMSMMEVITRAAADPAVDADKMERMLAMAERIQERQAKVIYAEAMARIQAEMPRITKSGVITDKHGAVRSTYAKYEDIDATIRPLLAREGFSINYDTEFANGLLIITIEVCHAGGHSEKRRTFMPKNEAPGASSAQNMGGTISYGKRYAVCQFFNIITVDSDHDGVDESVPISPEQVMEIEDLLQDSGANRTRFLQWLEIEKVEDISVGVFTNAKAKLVERLPKR